MKEELYHLIFFIAHFISPQRKSYPGVKMVLGMPKNYDIRKVY